MDISALFVMMSYYFSETHSATVCELKANSIPVIKACSDSSALVSRLIFDFVEGASLPADVTYCQCDITLNGGNIFRFVKLWESYPLSCGVRVEVMPNNDSTRLTYMTCGNIGSLVLPDLESGMTFRVRLLREQEPYVSNLCFGGVSEYTDMMLVNPSIPLEFNTTCYNPVPFPSTSADSHPSTTVSTSVGTSVTQTETATESHTDMSSTTSPSPEGMAGIPTATTESTSSGNEHHTEQATDSPSTASEQTQTSTQKPSTASEQTQTSIHGTQLRTACQVDAGKDPILGCYGDSRVGDKVYVDFANAEYLPVPQCTCTVDIHGGRTLTTRAINTPPPYRCGSLFEMAESVQGVSYLPQSLLCASPPDRTGGYIPSITYTVQTGLVFTISMLKVRPPYNTSFCMELTNNMLAEQPEETAAPFQDVTSVVPIEADNSCDLLPVTITLSVAAFISTVIGLIVTYMYLTSPKPTTEENDVMQHGALVGMTLPLVFP